ncbi:reverse transcriptase domain-containing protein [Tanacetum coccineum]
MASRPSSSLMFVPGCDLDASSERESVRETVVRSEAKLCDVENLEIVEVLYVVRSLRSLSLPSRDLLIKVVQKPKWKLASLHRFLSKSAENDFQWTPEAEEAFKQMKKLIAELPTLTAPREREELIIYLAAAKEAINAVLMTDREGGQIPV